MQYDDDFLVTKDGPVYTVTFNRPDKHNCLSVSMQKELHEVVRQVRFDEEARVLIFTGAGNTFCAGDDIVEFPELATRKLAYDSATALPEPASNPQSNGFLVTSMFQETAAMIENLIDVVTIAAVDGVCMGGGLEITLCCDFVLATPRSRWGMPEIDYGLTPGWGGCTRMQKVVGRRRAKEINLLAYEFTGRQAEQWGFVNRLVEPDNLASETKQLAELILAKSRYAIRRSKYVLRHASEAPISTAAAYELPIDAGAGVRDVNGFAAFTNKAEGLMDLRKRSSAMWENQRI